VIAAMKAAAIVICRLRAVVRFAVMVIPVSVCWVAPDPLPPRWRFASGMTLFSNHKSWSKLRHSF